MKKKLHTQLTEGYYSISKDTDALYSILAERSGVSEGMFWVLYAICMSEEQCTQRDICRVWAMNKQTVNSALRHLVREDFITMEVCTEDRRSKLLHFTEKGREFCDTYIIPIFEAEEQAFEELTEKERETLMGLTKKLNVLLWNHLSYLLPEEKGGSL